MWMPVHLSDHYYEKDKQYCGLYVVSKVELPDFSPTAELIRIFNKRGILIVSASIHLVNLTTTDFFIVDLTGKVNLKKSIRKEIIDCLSDRLLLFEFIETGVDGFIYNVKGFPLVFNFSDKYTPMAALGAESWMELLKGLMDRFGESGMVIIYEMGNGAGENKAEELKRLHSSLKCRDLILMALAQLQSFGWGRFEIMSCDEEGKRIRIRIFDDFEDIVTMDMPDYKSSLLRGFLVGLVSKLFYKACRGTIEKCIKMGDEHCEILIR
jgi:hypothetical protein